jgi:hypothetical protein
MSVIEPACSGACDTSSACGCKEQAHVEKRGPSVAAATAVAAAACTACCVLPLALPPVILGAAGGLMAVLDHAHGWVTSIAVAIVLVAWAWIGWQIVRGKRRMPGRTMALMILATVLTGVASAWPLLEPFAFSTLGVARGAHRNG